MLKFIIPLQKVKMTNNMYPDKEMRLKNKSFPGQKLSLPDRHITPRCTPRQMLLYPQRTERPVYSALHPKPLYSQPKRITRLPFLFLAFLLAILGIATLYLRTLSTTLPHTTPTGSHYVSTTVRHDVPMSQVFSKVQSQGTASSSSSSLAALKGVALDRINQLTLAVNKIKQSGRDVTAYQQKLEQDSAKCSTLTSREDAIALLIQIASDLTALQGDLAENNVYTLLSNFQQEAQQWGDAHKYHDPYDGNDYYLNSSYLSMDGHNGIWYGEGSYVKAEVDAGDPQASHYLKNDSFLLSMLEANYEDTTPYSQPHQVDQSLLNYFGIQHRRVLIVSLTEQAMRIYNNGTLEQAFQVTTGREYRPTPIGHFQLTQHFYNLTLTSYDKPGSPDYYPPVMVPNAIQFWHNGYLIHSSPWRKDYGPLTPFPHHDSGGDSQASVGSHGCINVPTDILSELASTITDQTPLVIF